MSLDRKRRLGLLITLVCVLLALVLAAIAVIAVRMFHRNDEPAPVEGQSLFQVFEAPLQRANGSYAALSDFRGRPLVVLFWSSWCEDCKAFLQNGYAEMCSAAEEAGARVALVCRGGVRDDDMSKARNALAQYGISETTLLDPDANLYRRMGLHGVPSIAVFDENGMLAYRTEDMPNAVQMKAMLAYLHAPAAQTMGFVRGHLMQQDGGVASNYYVAQSSVLPGDTVLSESQGLVMLYAVRSADQQLFEQAYGYVRRQMSANGLTAWQVVQGQPSTVNAGLDDLRILQALAEAQELWGGYEQDLALRCEAYATLVLQNDLPRDYVSLDGSARTDDVTLCYLDAATLRRLAVYDERFARAAERSEAVLRGGVISAAMPLYFPRYVDGDEPYYTGDELQMNEAMVTLLHAAEAGIAEPETLDWLEQTLSDGPLYAGYRLDGTVAPGKDFESTATYALLVRIALCTGRSELAIRALERMEAARSFAVETIGAYGSLPNTTHYTFDTLEALLAWQEAAQQFQALPQ